MKPKWLKQLEDAIQKNKHEHASRLIQFATKGMNSYPGNRTVVFRGFLPDSGTIMVVTDIRSTKVSHLKARPHGEVCWYFPLTREQFRLAVRCRLITHESSDSGLIHQREKIWNTLSTGTRNQFFWPDPLEEIPCEDTIDSRTPEKDIAGRGTEDREASHRDNSQPSAVPATFCLLLLTPYMVDHLSIQYSPHRRRIHTLQSNGSWSCKTVNP